jgi:hypothetical protein
MILIASIKKKFSKIEYYLFLYFMKKVSKKVMNECKKWTLVYSGTFAIKCVNLYNKIEIKKYVLIYIY